MRAIQVTRRIKTLTLRMIAERFSYFWKKLHLSHQLANWKRKMILMMNLGFDFHRFLRWFFFFVWVNKAVYLPLMKLVRRWLIAPGEELPFRNAYSFYHGLKLELFFPLMESKAWIIFPGHITIALACCDNRSGIKLSCWIIWATSVCQSYFLINH